jgi:hypothetical protein
MQVAVLGIGFAIGVAVFVAWVVVMLRQDQAHRLAVVDTAREQTRAHRDATLTAH